MTDVFSHWSYDKENDADRMRRTIAYIFSLTDIYMKRMQKRYI